ncbi:MAG TPA: isoleucine--tRNA ligase [Candidatus Aenigmarchaeota archaeon]|nr:isoleucine--tRNA ligase [Candidatus Aenigmarchaeota archaeon]
MHYNPKEIEKEILEKWEKEKIPEKIVSFSGNKFYLLDGPPYVNDQPHVGHILTTTFKDIWGKFKKMQGHSVWFQPGFDCGGLPIENKVEQKLNIKEKSDILKIGTEKFIKECNDFAKGNEKIWLETYKKLGAWRAYMIPYLTSENYYKESGWWAIKKIYEKGLLVKGKKPNFWCPRCETVLSGYEVTDAYKNISSPSIYIKFKIKNKDEFLLAWTTTPWTLPANVALCIHPDEIYVKVKVNGEILILAKQRLEVLKELNKKYEIIEEFKGKELEGTKYEPLLDIPLQKELEKIENAHKVVLSIQIIKKRVASKIKTKKGIKGEEEIGHLVDISTGTGIIHIAPGHGTEDFKLGEHYNLPSPSPIDEKGKLDNSTGIFYGMYVNNANNEIINYLKNKNLLFNNTSIIHSYPLCWRCKTPLIYRKSSQWLLKLDLIRDKILEEIKKIKWLPPHIEEQFRNIIESAPDWAITRQRFWGIPLPIWICKKCKKIKIIGSKEELRKEAIEKLDKDFDISVSVVDKIHLKCSCGREMEREKAILDVWFDSGIAPFASIGYPFKNAELFQKLYPVDLVDESQDQLRGWFYTLMLCGISIFDNAPYRIVCCNGWTLDEKGEKMSKSLGNVIWGKEAYEVLGADLLRLYVCQSSAPWETRSFSFREAKTLQNKLNILWNLTNFIESYSKNRTKVGNMNERLSNKWLLSKINSLVKEVTEDFENFRFHYAARKIIEFIVNDFSRTYIKLIRDDIDKETIEVMLYTLEKVIKILAPISPFITEYIYSKFFNGSVHLAEWPKVEKTKIDEELEEKIKLAEEISTAINSERQKHNVKLRFPLKKVYIYGFKEVENIIGGVEGIIRILSNVKEIEFKEIENIKIKPNFARIGKKFGEKTKKVVEIINKLKIENIKDKIKINGSELEKEDLIIDKGICEGEEFSEGYVVLELEEDEKLKKERFLRELIREIQKARKNLKLNVLDYITLYLEDKEFIKEFEKILRKEVRAKEIIYKLKNKKGYASYKDLSLEFGFSK